MAAASLADELDAQIARVWRASGELPPYGGLGVAHLQLEVLAEVAARASRALRGLPDPPPARPPATLSPPERLAYDHARRAIVRALDAEMLHADRLRVTDLAILLSVIERWGLVR